MAEAAQYRPRVVDEELAARLGAAGAVLIEGPRACGKTATGRRHAASEVLLDVDAGLRNAAELEPSIVLEGPAPRLLDEWQTVPSIWNHVRRAVDIGGGAGRFILTGSAVPPDDTTRHTGAGRVSRLPMRPMSLFESGHSTGEMSLGAMLRSQPVPAQHVGTTVTDLVEFVCRGGWPGTIGAAADDAGRFVRDYVEEIRRADLRRVDGVRRDPVLVRRVLQSLARNVATEAAVSVIAADAGGKCGSPAPGDRSELSERPGAGLRDRGSAGLVRASSFPFAAAESPKRHFVDPSLAVAALRSGPERLRTDLVSFGFLFESLVVRDLRVYSQARDAEVYHYRDNTGLEVDAIVETAGGAWMGVEIKLGGEGPIEEGASNLLKLRDRVDPDRTGPPAALAVITGVGPRLHPARRGDARTDHRPRPLNLPSEAPPLRSCKYRSIKKTEQQESVGQPSQRQRSRGSSPFDSSVRGIAPDGRTRLGRATSTSAGSRSPRSAIAAVQTGVEVALALAGEGGGDDAILGRPGEGGHVGGEVVRDLDAPREQNAASHPGPGLHPALRLAFGAPFRMAFRASFGAPPETPSLEALAAL